MCVLGEALSGSGVHPGENHCHKNILTTSRPMPEKGGMGQAQAHGALTVQGLELGALGSCPRHFPPTRLTLLPYLLFVAVGSEIASPDSRSLDSQGSPACREPVSSRLSSVLNSRDSFFGKKQKEAWDSRLRPAALLFAPCFTLVRFPSGAGSSPPSGLTHRAQMATPLPGEPGARRQPPHPHLVRSNSLEPGFLPDVAAAVAVYGPVGVQSILDNPNTVTGDIRGVLSGCCLLST